MSDRPYSRLYWSVMDDDKFDGIREDMRHFGTWSLLLMVADMAWPAPAFIPPAPKASVAALVQAGLVDLLSGGRYRIHGLAAERGRRSEAAREAGLASARSRSQRTPVEQPVSDRSTPSQLDETRRDETRTSQDETTRERPDGRADLEAFLVITRRAPTTRQRRLLDDVLDRHDLTGPAWAADVMFKNPSDPIGAVIEADKAWRAERIAAAQAAESPKPIPRRPKGYPEPIKDLMADWAATAPKGDAA